MKLDVNLINKFWKNVEVIPFHSCWEWSGPRDIENYGRLFYNDKYLKAHRVSFLIHYGDLPSGRLVCHRCDNPGCVNPAHLFSGTPKENTLDMMRKGRHRGGKKDSHGRRKLGSSDVDKIKALISKKSMTQSEIGKMFGVSQAQICRISRGENWNG